MKISLEPRVQERLAPIQNHPETFTPKESVITELGEKALIMVVSPCGGGKGYAIDLTIALDPRFRKSRSLTSRPPRKDDTPDTIRYIERTNEGIEAFCETIENGDFVNFIFHPETEEIYGTTLIDHPGEFNLMPTLTGSIDYLKSLPFKRTEVIGLTNEPLQWRQWFNAREFRDDADRAARLAEGRTSLQWLLDHPELSIIPNMPDTDVAAAIQHIAITGSLIRDEAMAIAQLNYMRSII